jgi:hypothetical protein
MLYMIETLGLIYFLILLQRNSQLVDYTMIYCLNLLCSHNQEENKINKNKNCIENGFKIEPLFMLRLNPWYLPPIFESEKLRAQNQNLHLD